MNARFRLATPEITSYFKSIDMMAFNRKDLEEILLNNRKDWMLKNDFTVGAFIDNLVEYKILKKKELTFLQHNYLVYSKSGKVDIYELVGKASDKGYFSHLSAIYLHDLTVQVPNTVYLSIEQPRLRNNPENRISQQSIDESFYKEAKLSNAYTKIMLNKKQWTIYQIYRTGYYHENENYSLESYVKNNGIEYKRTSLERTLIDIAIRPEYSGGIEIVREAYYNAQNKVSANRIGAILQGMKTVYPYHQSIGFLMEISGNYTESQLGIMKRIPQEYDFYLIHGYKKVDLKYNKEWRIFYPSYLEI